MKNLNDLFEHTLQDVYYAKNAGVKLLTKTQNKARDTDLAEAISVHLGEARTQITALEAVFQSLGQKPKGEKCDAIEGLIKETEGVMSTAKGDVAINAGIIAALQAVKHYEISRYGSLREWAKVLGHAQAHTLLSEILDEEKAFNNKLTNLAVTSVNSAEAVNA